MKQSPPGLILSKSQTMSRRICLGIIMVLFAAGWISAPAAEESALDPVLLRRRILDSVGTLPWNPADGYVLEGRFVLKATGKEIDYKARYARSPDRWAAEFSQEDRSRNLRYVYSRGKAWIASPEITMDVNPGLLPYMARFDFPQLYEELLRILEKGNRAPSFAIGAISSEIHIRGELRNGREAVFILNNVEYFPRKILVTAVDEFSAAWLVPSASPDGSCSPTPIPRASSEFEIWLSEPMDAGTYRYARRMDFVEDGTVVGTFYLEDFQPAAVAESIFIRPQDFPWTESVRFSPSADLRRNSIYLHDSEIPGFRARVKEQPWSEWARESGLVAFWAALTLWIGRIFPQSISLRLLVLSTAIAFLGFLFLLVRRRRQYPGKYSWRLLVGGIFLCCAILAAGMASHQLRNPQQRSLIALHSAIRHAVTGASFYAEKANALLLNIKSEAPARSMDDLGFSCQAYTLAYDLIRPGLPRERCLQIEQDLFDYAKPLFGTTRGWASNTPGSIVFAAGLGMVGLETGYEPYIVAARDVIDKALETQLDGGLYQSGPGKGSGVMDSAANLFYGLKRTGRADYYAHAAFRQYVDTSLKMLSPVGTLPLFGDTSLDQSARLSAFFLKVANQIPEDEGRRCIAASNRYWAYGRYHAEGRIRWILPVFQPMMSYFENPYPILQYTRRLPIVPLPASSAVLGNNRSAVLRSGSQPDSVYLALNMVQSDPESSHRNILAFDLYAFRSLLLHGPGFPGRNRSRYRATTRTASVNSITLDNEDQSTVQCTGIESSLLNQPLFDYVRALADKTYNFGQVRRDIVMARPGKNQPGYFFILDDVFTIDPRTTVQWHLHGRGKLATGINQRSRWTSAPFNPPKLRPDRIHLEVVHPIGIPGSLSTKSGMLYSESRFLNQESESTIVEWMGSGKICTLLYPYKHGEGPEKIERLGKISFRIGGTDRVGTTDWISLGSLDALTTIGPLMHRSKYTIARDRLGSFPGILMVSGIECRFGIHYLFSTKPVTASLSGLYGGFLNALPETQVTLRSPEILEGDRFLLDNQTIAAAKAGVLRFLLLETGEHSLRRFSARPQK
jgi:hypothetical protein